MTSQQDTELPHILDDFAEELKEIRATAREDYYYETHGMSDDIDEAYEKAIQALTSWKDKEVTITENTSDGYHTFKELYEFRMLYNAAYFNELAREPYTGVCKSWRHSDGEECFGGGWFVVIAQLPTGQITNHYEAKDWDLFQIPEVDKAPEWDGHTAQDVAKRLRESLQSQGGKNE